MTGTFEPPVGSRPDFSGRWVLNREASALSPHASGMRSAVAHIEHREPTFHYQAEFVGEGDPIKIEYEMKSDGGERVSPHQGVTVASRLHWEGEALVFTTRIQRLDGEMTICFRHELLDAGRRLRAAEQLRGGGRDQDNVWIFDRARR